MRFLIFAFVLLSVCSADAAPLEGLSTQSRELRDEGYVHNSETPVRIRIVVLPAGMVANRAVDWSRAGIGWDVSIYPGIRLRAPRELIPLSVHEYKFKEKSEGWPSYDMLAPTLVFRREKNRDNWIIVAQSDRRFIWDAGFALRDGDVIALRENNGY